MEEHYLKKIINDNFLDFWFRFLESKKVLKETQKSDTAFTEIWSELLAYEGRIFEELVLSIMIEENPLDIKFSKAGKYWNRKGDTEIDAVFLDAGDKKAYLFEVKIIKEKINAKLLQNLMRKGLQIPELKDYELIVKTAFAGKDDIVLN